MALARGKQQQAQALVGLIVLVALGSTRSPVEAAFTGENGTIAFSAWEGDNDELLGMDSDGANEVNITNSPWDDELEPNWSADGSRVTFYGTSSSCTAIFVMNADGSERRQLTEGTGCDASPVWSPDSGRIAFVRKVYVDGGGESYDIMVMNADGSAVMNVTNTYPGNESQPAWAPDGTKIAFTGVGALEVMDADGGNRHALGSGGEPAWSPDGTKIAHVRTNGQVNNGPVYDVFVMDADGTNLSQVTDLRARTFSPDWSPDEEWIAFESTQDAPDPTFCDGVLCNYEIYKVRASGGDVVRLTDRPAADRYPSWRPVTGPIGPPTQVFVSVDTDPITLVNQANVSVRVEGVDGSVVKIFVNDGDLGTPGLFRQVTLSSAVTVRFNVSGLVDGTIRARAVANDPEGRRTEDTDTAFKDTVPPNIIGERSPPPNAAGWNTTDVTVSFACSDAGSGISGCSTPSVVSDEGRDQSVTGSAVDGVGNAATAAVGGISIDRTAPGTSVNATVLALGEVTGLVEDALSGADAVWVRYTDFLGSEQIVEAESEAFGEPGPILASWRAATPSLPGPYVVDSFALDSAGNLGEWSNATTIVCIPPG